MTLTPIESSHIAAYAYHEECGILRIQFRNGDQWDYFGVGPDRFVTFEASESKGSYFSSVIRPAYQSVKVHTGTLAERAEIWLRSKEAAEFKGSAVALQMGRPVSVCAWMELEKIADLRALYEGDKSVVIVEVPNAVEARVE